MPGLSSFEFAHSSPYCQRLHHISIRAREYTEVADAEILTLGQLWYNLNARRANTDTGYAFAGKVVCVVPSSRVQELSLEVLETVNSRPFPIALRRC